MSVWSSCNAVVSVGTYREIPNFRELVELAIKHAPKITGSEGYCEYHLESFYSSMSMSYPCFKCPLLNYSCKGWKNINPKNCRVGEFPDELCHIENQCTLIITSPKGLRDKTKKRTVEEFNSLISYLEKVYDGLFVVEVIMKKIN